MFGHAAGEQVELKAGDRVARIGATVDLEDRADHVAATGEGL